MAVRNIADGITLHKVWLSPPGLDGRRLWCLEVRARPYPVQDVGGPLPFSGDQPAVVVEHGGDDRVQLRYVADGLPLQVLAHVHLGRDGIQRLQAQPQQLRDLPRPEQAHKRQGYVQLALQGNSPPPPGSPRSLLRGVGGRGSTRRSRGTGRAHRRAKRALTRFVAGGVPPDKRPRSPGRPRGLRQRPPSVPAPAHGAFSPALCRPRPGAGTLPDPRPGLWGRASRCRQALAPALSERACRPPDGSPRTSERAHAWFWATPFSRGLMSTRQPVSLAASRAFWPSRPMASDSWSLGTRTCAV